MPTCDASTHSLIILQGRLLILETSAVEIHTFDYETALRDSAKYLSFGCTRSKNLRDLNLTRADINIW